MARSRREWVEGVWCRRVHNNEQCELDGWSAMLYKRSRPPHDEWMVARKKLTFHCVCRPIGKITTQQRKRTECKRHPNLSSRIQ